MTSYRYWTPDLLGGMLRICIVCVLCVGGGGGEQGGRQGKLTRKQTRTCVEFVHRFPCSQTVSLHRRPMRRNMTPMPPVAAAAVLSAHGVVMGPQVQLPRASRRKPSPPRPRGSCGVLLLAAANSDRESGGLSRILGCSGSDQVGCGHSSFSGGKGSFSLVYLNAPV